MQYVATSIRDINISSHNSLTNRDTRNINISISPSINTASQHNNTTNHHSNSYHRPNRNIHHRNNRQRRNQNRRSSTSSHNQQLNASNTVATPIPSLISEDFKILQLNCNGLRSKIHEITHFMDKENIMVAAIQGAKLNAGTKLTISNYSIIRNDREKDKGGGLAFIVNDMVNYRIVDLGT